MPQEMGPGVSLAACSCPQLAVGDAEVVASEQHRGGCEQGTLLGVEALMLGNLQALSLALAPAPLVPFATLFERAAVQVKAGGRWIVTH